MRKIRSTGFMLSFCLVIALTVCSCGKKNQADTNIKELDEAKISHSWYYFSANTIQKTDLPQHAPAVLEKPWTEAVRISSAASVPSGMDANGFTAFAVVNKAGILACDAEGAHLYCDTSLFSTDTADTLVFSNGAPVFYLYRNSFFNDSAVRLSPAKKTAATTTATVSPSRPFLVEFNPQSRICYPLVSYANLKLTDADQITGYFWNGKTWACSAKKMLEDKVTFSYFYWEPLVALTDLSPAITTNQFSFSPLTEDKYRSLNMPLRFANAPTQLKELLASLPAQFCFYITWRDNSGTSPVSYFQQGNDISPVNAFALDAEKAGYTAALFADGTTFLKKNTDEKVTAFRLPRLPEGFSYADFAIAGDMLYVAWEETNFYKTARAGFLTVDLLGVLEKTK